MGAWNHSFWDNDDCVEILRLFFVHLGVVSDKGVVDPHSCAVISPPMRHMGSLMLRTKEEDIEELQCLFYTLTKQTLESVLERVPDFVQKLKYDVEHQLSHCLDHTGLNFDTFWVLLRVHVGMLVNVDELEAAANEFEPRRLRPVPNMEARNRPGNGWNLGQHLETFIRPQATWTSPARMEKQRNKDAKIIRDGLLEYKATMHDAPKDLKPLKLPFLGLRESSFMWRASKLLPLKRHWNLDLDETTGMIHNFPILDLRRCACCHISAEELGQDLLECQCRLHVYCDTACQKKCWREHRFAHQLRSEGVRAARAKEGLRRQKLGM